MYGGKEYQDAAINGKHLGLYDFHARYYNPMLGRWFSIDPALQTTNPYLYNANSPAMYVDPNGEFFFTILAAIFCPVLLPMAIQTDIGWISGGVGAAMNGESFWEGAAIGGLIGAANGALSMISPINIPFGDSGFGLSIAPQISVGTDGLGLGFNATLGYDIGKGFTAGLNFGGSYYAAAPGTGNSGWEARLGYGIGYKGEHFQAGIGSTYFASGETSQLNGQIYAGGGNWRLTYENDTWAPVPGLLKPGGAERDRFRTAALRFDVTGGKLKGANAGMNIFTGQAEYPDQYGNYDGGSANKYRMGAFYVGYKNTRVGVNNESMRAAVQNGFHDVFGAPHWKQMNSPNRMYFGIYSSNPYTVW